LRGYKEYLRGGATGARAAKDRDTRDTGTAPETTESPREGHGNSGQQTEDREGNTSPQRQKKPATGASRGIRKGSAFTGWAFLFFRVLGVFADMWL